MEHNKLRKHRVGGAEWSIPEGLMVLVSGTSSSDRVLEDGKHDSSVFGSRKLKIAKGEVEGSVILMWSYSHR